MSKMAAQQGQKRKATESADGDSRQSKTTRFNVSDVQQHGQEHMQPSGDAGAGSGGEPAVAAIGLCDDWNGFSDSEDDGRDESDEDESEGESESEIEDESEGELEEITGLELEAIVDEGDYHDSNDDNGDGEHQGDNQPQPQQVLTPPAKQGAVHDENIHPPSPKTGATLDPALLPAVSPVTSRAWNKKRNTNTPYNSLSQKQQEERHRLILQILRLWPGVPFLRWIPNSQRPKRLAKSPYDLSTKTLRALKNLAELTEGNIHQARQFIHHAPKWNWDEEGRRGEPGMLVGSRDIKKAWKAKLKHEGMKEMREFMEKKYAEERAARKQIKRETKAARAAAKAAKAAKTKNEQSTTSASNSAQNSPTKSEEPTPNDAPQITVAAPPLAAPPAHNTPNTLPPPSGNALVAVIANKVRRMTM